MIFFLFVALIFGFTSQCIISGTQIGQCVNLVDVVDQVGFCEEELSPTICVPIKRTIWPNYDIQYRNDVIQKLFMQNIQEMLVQEFVHKNSVLKFENSLQCSEAYKKFLCQINFPRCNSLNSSVPLCLSYCTDFLSSCGRSKAPCYLVYAKIYPGFDQEC